MAELGRAVADEHMGERSLGAGARGFGCSKSFATSCAAALTFADGADVGLVARPGEPGSEDHYALSAFRPEGDTLHQAGERQAMEWEAICFSVCMATVLLIFAPAKSPQRDVQL
jgi:hypothetical protein